MKIQVLGTGCPRCKSLAQLVERAVAELGLTVDVEATYGMETLLAFGVMSPPALVIDGVLQFAGKIPSLLELKSILHHPKS